VVIVFQINILTINLICDRWKRARNREWNATLDSIKRQNSYCAGQAKNTLDIAKTVAINGRIS